MKQAMNITAHLLAYAYTIMFAGVLAAQFYMAFKQIEIPDGATRMLDISLGVLFGLVVATANKFFGSSWSSERKTEMMEAKKTDATESP